MTIGRRGFLASAGGAVLLAASARRGGSRAAANSSGLPWPSGVSSWRPEPFAEWRGRPLDILTVFSRFDTWQQMRHLGREGTMLGEHLGRPERLSASLAMFPRHDGPVPRDQPELWGDAAEGRYDEAWRDGFANLRRLTERDDFVFRVGWEWNSDTSFPWGIVDENWAEAYRATFRRFVAIAREPFPRSQIDWCSLKRGAQRHVDPFYPGGDVVDFIGHDRYDRNPAAVSVEAWDDPASAGDGPGATIGVRAWLDYARDKGKPLSIPEWGVWSHGGRGGGGAGDNPVFIEQMFAFFQQNADAIGYECYFNQSGGPAQHTIGPGDGPNPEASEAYARLYRPD